MADLPQEGREELRALRVESPRLSRLESGGEYEAGVRAARDAIAQARTARPVYRCHGVVSARAIADATRRVRRSRELTEEAFFSARDAGAIEVVPNAGCCWSACWTRAR